MSTYTLTDIRNILTFIRILFDVLETPQRIMIAIADKSRHRVQQAVHVVKAPRIAHLALERCRSAKRIEKKEVYKIQISGLSLATVSQIIQAPDFVHD